MKRQIFFGLILLTVFCAASVFAQEKITVSGNQCEMAVNEDFVSEKLNLQVVNSDIRDILNYITEQTGCDFAVEDKVGKIDVTTRIDDLSWNVALKTILKTHKLDMMIKNATLVETGERKKLIFIGTERKIYCESSGLCCNGVYPSENNSESLYTEFIKLENLPDCPNNAKCEQKLSALNQLKAKVALHLSEKGQIEFDEPSQTLIVTDVRANIDKIRNLIKIINTKEFYKESESVNNKQSL